MTSSRILPPQGDYYQNGRLFAYFFPWSSPILRDSTVLTNTDCANSKAFLISCSYLEMIIISLMWWLAQSHSKHDRCRIEEEPNKTLSLNPLLIYGCPGKAPLSIDRSASNIREYKLGNLWWHLAASYFLQCHSSWMLWAIRSS